MQPEMKAEAKATLYLQNWQKRMIKDFTDLKHPERISKILIQPGKGDCPGSYRILSDHMRHDDFWIYLTDEQMVQLNEELRLDTPIAVLNITSEGIRTGAVVIA